MTLVDPSGRLGTPKITFVEEVDIAKVDALYAVSAAYTPEQADQLNATGVRMSLISDFRQGRRRAPARRQHDGRRRSPPPLPQEYTKDNPLKVALVLHGTLGDKSFFDDAASGMKQAEAELPVDGQDHRSWAMTAPSGRPASPMPPTSGYDVIIAGTFDMTGYIVELAAAISGRQVHRLR